MCREKVIRRDLMLLVSLLLLAALSTAQGLPGCRSVSSSTSSYLILLDPLQWDGLSADTAASVQNNMRFIVGTNVASLNNELSQMRFADGQPVPDLQPVPCENRKHVGPYEFDELEFGTLSQYKVVLELWGNIVDRQSGVGTLYFVLVPVRPFTRPAISEVDVELGPAAQAKNSMPRFLEKNKRLKAYAQVVLGVRLYSNYKFPEAIKYMCQGISDLKKTWTSAQAPAKPEVVDADKILITELNKVVVDAVNKNRQTSSVAATLANVSPQGCDLGGQ